MRTGDAHKRQFIKAKNQEVTEAVVRSATTGIKEADTSVTSVLNDLFSPMSRKRVKDLGLTEEQESRYVNRLGRDIEASGSMDKIALGL
jgi:chromosome transmission fidelity protein 18